MFSVAEKLKTDVDLYVNEGIKVEERSWTTVDRETKEEIERTGKFPYLEGVLLTSDYRPGTFKRVKINIQDNSYGASITSIEAFQKIAENLTSLVAGDKFINAEVLLTPKSIGAGGSANFAALNLKDLHVVESDDNTKGFIAKMLNGTVEETAPERE